MEKVSLDALDSRMGPADVKRPLSPALDAEGVTLNYYELAPGDSFGFGYHRHADQEEVFYVQHGDVDVGAGEVVRFSPGEWQLGTNRGDERVVALALGAPADAGATEMLRECTDCGGRTENRVEMADDRDALVTVCEQCEAETGRFA